MKRRDFIKNSSLILVGSTLPFQEIPLKIYRTPKLSEFVDGFEYQQKHTHRMMWLDMSDRKLINGEGTDWIDTWSNYVYNGLELKTYEDGKQYIEYTSPNGTKWSLMYNPMMYDPIHQIKGLLEGGSIRVRVL